MKDFETKEQVDKVKEDIKSLTGYKLSDKQIKELLNTGRTCIPLLDFAPVLKKVVNYFHTADAKDLIWSLSLNSYSGVFEITLKESQINF